VPGKNPVLKKCQSPPIDDGVEFRRLLVGDSRRVNHDASFHTACRSPMIPAGIFGISMVLCRRWSRHSGCRPMSERSTRECTFHPGRKPGDLPPKGHAHARWCEGCRFDLAVSIVRDPRPSHSSSHWRGSRFRIVCI